MPREERRMKEERDGAGESRSDPSMTAYLQRQKEHDRAVDASRG